MTFWPCPAHTGLCSLYIHCHPQPLAPMWLVVQLVKNLPAMQETRVQFLGREDPLEKEMATNSSTLAWRIPKDTGAWQATVHGVARVGHNLATKPPPAPFFTEPNILRKTGIWHLGSFAALLAPGQKSPWATKYKESIRNPKITVHMCSWGKLWIRYEKIKKTQLSLPKSQEQKQSICTLHVIPPREYADLLSHTFCPTLGSNPTLIPYKEPALPSPTCPNQGATETVTCFPSRLLQRESQYSLAWISCLASYKFLLITKAKNPGQ